MKQRPISAALLAIAIALIGQELTKPSSTAYSPDDCTGIACRDTPAPLDGARAESDHLLFGNPSSASVVNPDNYLLQRPEYALSYNASRGTANWASWHLSAAWLGPVERQDDFRPDVLLPSGTYAVRPDDYRGSGYDRGHLVPSGDRTAGEAMNSATFVMTNMIPQTPENNREVWRQLEEFSRDVVRQGQELYVVAGVYGDRGRIADGEVTVPTNIWKVALVLPEGAGLEAATATTPVVAVDIPNGDRLQGWDSYLTTVDAIEAATGYDLLSNLPQNIEAEIEARRFQGL